MEFGMEMYYLLKEKDFVLEEKPQAFLPGKKAASPKLLLGLPQWTNKTLFPPGTKSSDMLELYAKKFNVIELNSSHYSIPSLEQVRKWREKTSGGFFFCPKFPKAISHASMRLNRAKQIETNKFLDSIHVFAEHLGPAFMQMIEFYENRNESELLDYLSWVPREENIFVEVRHKSWFASGEVVKNFSEKLHAIKKGWVITDTPGRRDAVHLQLPIAKAFIRFVCKGDETLDRFRIAEWNKLLKHWFDNGLEECYFILHVHNSEVEGEFYEFAKAEFTAVEN